MTRPTLLAFLKTRYTARLAQKLATIFDWSNGMIDYDVFYKELERILIKPKDANEMQHVRLMKRFAFMMLDMNCDQMLCETDLFTFLQSHDQNDFFRETLNHDIQAIAEAFTQRNKQLQESK